MTTDPHAIALGEEAPPPAGASEGGLKASLTAVLSFTQGLMPVLVAVIILWYFGTIIKQMLGLTDPATISGERWGRNVYLYAGVEALAYTAAGFLFGREVNRQRAERAEENAFRAQREANSAQWAAARSVAKGHALAEGVRELERAQGSRSVAAGTAAPPAQTDVRMLRGLADRFFPPQP